VKFESGAQPRNFAPEKPSATADIVWY
jgi:hypothetical protein